jgi:hypothetical protein
MFNLFNTNKKTLKRLEIIAQQVIDKENEDKA